MTTIKRFTPDYKMHAVRFEAFAREAEHGELVRFDAHQQVVSAVEAERDAQQKRADALAVRNEILTAFLTEGFNIAGKGGSWCGGDIQELGEKLGLFARETYQPALHGYHCGHEPGEDSVYVITNSSTDAALAAIQAQGVEKLADKLDAEIEQIMSGAFFYDEISSREAISKMVREYATELREAK
ncbi:hypothetical protein [Serratia marcescens]|uniref:hypothetical protein n=1 Tax=Serratia marcescens TaxID=615 RepID=UPI0027E52AF8|nr:hypothetical protein [Serratia marcescens]WLS18602.1 hypothetical protein RAA91_21025 [Serratia marcescens]HCB1445090.1 hypothetical protein [Serratia marcescens]HCB1484241.1 hypothetical protein [Serratia marcescens]HCB1614386.1 hypothetical protein [Serratia marcescens]HCB1619631.1 hypothetical protein [Serratia marcescens]